MLEHRPVPMPAYARARVVPDQQGLNEIVGSQPRKCSGLIAHGQQPVRDRIGGAEPSVIEIIAPAERGCQPLACPTSKAEGREVGGVDFGNQCLFFGRRDELLGQGQTRQHRGSIKKVGLSGDHGAHADMVTTGSRRQAACWQRMLNGGIDRARALDSQTFNIQPQRLPNSPCVDVDLLRCKDCFTIQD